MPVLYLTDKPGPPTDLTVDDVEKDKIDLSWKRPNYFTVTGYFLEINQDTGWVNFAQVKIHWLIVKTCYIHKLVASCFNKKWQGCKWPAATSLLPSCNRLLATTSRYHDAYAWLATACSRQVCWNCQRTDLLQVDCQDYYPRACCQLIQQVVTTLQITSCNKPARFQQTCCDMMRLTSSLELVGNQSHVILPRNPSPLST